jgi:hypothetical protein
MKKSYIKPFAEMIDFKLDESIMDGLDGPIGGEETVPDSGFDWDDF